MHNSLALVIERRSGKTSAVRHIPKYIVLGSSGHKGAIARLENRLVSTAAMGKAQTEENSNLSSMGKLGKVPASGDPSGSRGTAGDRFPL
jgi:myosin heavy subunit